MVEGRSYVHAYTPLNHTSRSYIETDNVLDSSRSVLRGCCIVCVVVHPLPQASQTDHGGGSGGGPAGDERLPLHLDLLDLIKTSTRLYFSTEETWIVSLSVVLWCYLRTRRIVTTSCIYLDHRVGGQLNEKGLHERSRYLYKTSTMYSSATKIYFAVLPMTEKCMPITTVLL